MKTLRTRPLLSPAAPILALVAAISAFAQPPGGPGFGPPRREELKLVSRFDRDGNQRLDRAERDAAHVAVAEERSARPARGPRPELREQVTTTPQPGEKLTAADVQRYDREPLYDTGTLRTLFFEFESTDWEQELEAFHDTDVEVPAALTVDGQAYRDVGVHFRGASSYMMVPTGAKRPLNVTIDFAHKDQNLLGHRTLNLLNAHEDASFLRTVLFSQIAQDYLAAPRANFVRVVINGENWGLYVSQEQFNKDFLRDRFGTTNGARWKAPGSPNGRASLAYLGEDPAAYRGIYELKSKDDPKAWVALIRLCRVLNETPPEKLEAALAPLLDIDGALKFLALENTLVNADGYWTRTSDYSLYEDASGRFHLLPHDMNETFSLGGGPGGRSRGPRGDRGGFAPGFAPGGMPPPPPPRGGPGRGFGPGAGGPMLDPLLQVANEATPLISKLLAVPALRERYLRHVRDIATTWLDWARLGPIAQRYHELIAADVKRDTRKLESFEDFATSVDGPTRSLKNFAEQRRQFLLSHAAIKALPEK